MTDDELIEKMALAAWKSEGFTDDQWSTSDYQIRNCNLAAARAALAIARPIIEREAYELIEASVEHVAKALWHLDCKRSAEDYRREKWQVPDNFADPWHESGCGIRQQQMYMREAEAFLTALAASQSVVGKSEGDDDE